MYLILFLALLAALVFLGVRHMRKRKAEQRARVALEPPLGKPDGRDLIPTATDIENQAKKEAWERDHPGMPYPGTVNPKTSSATPPSASNDTQTKEPPAPPAPKPGTKGTTIGGTPFRRPE